MMKLNVIPLLGLALAFACTDDGGKTPSDTATVSPDEGDADTDADTDTDTGPTESNPTDSGAGN